jgi:hypothetical protein
MKIVVEFDTNYAGIAENLSLQIKEILEQAAMDATRAVTGKDEVRVGLTDANNVVVGSVATYEDGPEWRTVVTRRRVRVCPRCGGDMRVPTDPDARATFGWQCTQCRKVV